MNTGLLTPSQLCKASLLDTLAIVSDLSGIGLNLTLAGIVVSGFAVTFAAGLFGFLLKTVYRMLGFGGH